MNKSELIAALSEETGLTKSEAKRAINALFDPNDGIIVSEVAEDESVQITGFGSFSLAHRKARTGKNPQTGEPLEIPESWGLKFKAGKGVKDALNA